MKKALELMEDAKRVLMRDSDQYVIMLFKMIEQDSKIEKAIKDEKEDEKLQTLEARKEELDF